MLGFFYEFGDQIFANFGHRINITGLFHMYERRAYFLGFLIVAAAIIHTFYFRDWTDYNGVARRYAELDKKDPSSAEVMKIEGLLRKLTADYGQPLDTVERYTDNTHEFLILADSLNCLGAFGDPVALKDCLNKTKKTHLEILQGVDQLNKSKKDIYKNAVWYYMTCVLEERNKEQKVMNWK